MNAAGSSLRANISSTIMLCMKSYRRILVALSAGILCLAGALAAEEGPVPKVVADYLPTYVYDDENTRIHVRIPEKTSAESGTEIVLKARSEKSEVIATYSSRAPFPEFQFLIPGGTLTRCSSLVLEYAGSASADNGSGSDRRAAPAPVLEISVAKSWEKLPPLHAAGGLFETTDGNKAIVVVKHVRDESRRKWVLVRKAMEWMKRRQPPDKVTLLTDLPADASKSQKGSLVICPSRDLSASLCALTTLSRETSIGKDTAILIMLGTSDLRAGIDEVTFRRSLEAVIQQIRFMGVERVRLATPVAAPFHAEKLKKYEKVVENTAWRFRLEPPVKSSRYISKDSWLEDPYTGSARATLSRETTQVLVLGLLGAWR